MKQEDMRREMEAIMEQLSPNRQRYLLELARASKKAEGYLDEPDAPSHIKQTPTEHEDPPGDA